LADEDLIHWGAEEQKDFVDLSLTGHFSNLLSWSWRARSGAGFTFSGLVDFEEADQGGELAMIWNLS
jgi:hypothetical protein